MKKALKILLCIIIALSLCQSIFASNILDQPNSFDKLHEQSQEQYRDLMTSFGFEDALTDIVYPDNYGGAYINDDGILVVTTTEHSINRAANISSALSGTYIMDTVEYSYNKLNALKEDVDNALEIFYANKSAFTEDEASLLESIVQLYVSQKDNAVVIGISGLSDEKVSRFNDMFGSSHAYTFIEGGHTTPTAIALKGGIKVWLENGDGASIGWPVYFYDNNGKVCKGFISAGHAYDVGDVAYVNGVEVGECVKSKFSGKVDAAIIKITNADFSMSNKVAYSNDTLSNTKNVLVAEGETIYKSGATSEYRSGTVIATNATINYKDFGVTIRNTLVTDALNLPGDSGGVVYCKYGGQFFAIGSSSGSTTYNENDEITESTFDKCYVSQLVNAVSEFRCSYTPIS